MRFRRSCVAAWLVLPVTLAAQAASPTPGVTRTGSLTAAGIRESSGIAVSRTHRGVLWTHNDSGDAARIYAVDLSGRLLATFEVPGARAVDWEDMALGPCPPPRAARACLFIGDIGDNLERRTRVVLYALAEPDPATAIRGRGQSELALALRVSYADGPRDAETLIAAPDGTLTIVSKGRSGPIARYEVPATAWAHDSLIVTPTDTLPIQPQPLLGRWVTGGAMSPDGRTIVLRTSTEVYRFVAGPRWTPMGSPCWIGWAEPQGEAVDFLDADRLVVTSEKGFGGEGSIGVVRCP
jgi:hypothetical protein